jgi:hypothetical protein
MLRKLIEFLIFSKQTNLYEIIIQGFSITAIKV